MSGAPVVVVVGRPGSGKGTQAERLSCNYGLPIVDLGRRLREECDRTTQEGRLLAALKPGEYAPHEIAEALLVQELRQAENISPGLILDGYPRFAWQVERLDDLLSPRAVSAVVMLDVDVETAVRRLVSRVICTACGRNAPAGRSALAACLECGGSCGARSDDDITALRRRLVVYEAQLAGIFDRYAARALLHRIDGSASPEVTEARLANALRGTIAHEILPRSQTERQLPLFGN